MFAEYIRLSSFRLPRLLFYLGVLLIAQTRWRPILSFTLSDWLFLAAFLCALIVLMGQSKVEIPIPKIVLIGLGLFMVGGLLSTIRAQFPISSLIALLKYFYLFGVWVWLGTILLRRSEEIRDTMIFWTISAAVTSAGAAIQMLWGDVIPGGNFPITDRMTGFSEHFNDLGEITSVALVPALYVATHDHQKTWLSFCMWFSAFLVVAGLIWSSSLTGIVAAATGLLIWMITNKAGLKHFGVLVIGGATILFLILIASNSVNGLNRLAVVTTHEESLGNKHDILKLGDRLRNLKNEKHRFPSLLPRYTTYDEAWESISQNFIVGVGLGPANGRTSSGHVVHNLWLGSWYEGGFFALLGICLLVGGIAKIGLRIFLDSSLEESSRMMGASLFAAHSSLLVLGLAHPIYYKRFVWIPTLLLIALYVRNKVEERLEGKAEGLDLLTR
ncbi:MAG: hypothetical protein GKS05_02840 [Nitrospirales bacterium]|nr:hypothetical protein [Nitrospirales bacterium]